jgi:predicted nucleic acid-binding Zn ribbon protein
MTSRGHLGELLDELMRRYSLDRRARAQSAITLWPEVVGRDIARNAWPTGVAEGTLRVAVSNHAWAQTLHLMRGSLLEALNVRIGGDVLREIQVRVGTRSQPSPAARESQNPAPGNAAPPALTREDRERIRELTDGIADAELRARVRRAATGLVRLRRWREAQRQRRCPSCGRFVSGRRRMCPACAGRQ